MKEGEAKPPSPSMLIPYAGFFTVLKHGTDAEITAGAPFSAFVTAKQSFYPSGACAAETAQAVIGPMRTCLWRG
jgi:hypothetical protein